MLISPYLLPSTTEFEDSEVMQLCSNACYDGVKAAEVLLAVADLQI